jgi:hypothetical protein
MFGFNALEFDGNFLARNDIGAYGRNFVSVVALNNVNNVSYGYRLTEVNITKTAATDLSTNTVLITNTQILSCISKYCSIDSLHRVCTKRVVLWRKEMCGDVPLSSS